MVTDAESHAAEDQKKRETIETRNQADAVVYQTEKFLKEQGEKIPADKKAKAEAAVERLKKAVKDENTDEMKSAMDAVNSEMQAISQDLYASTAQQQQQPPPEAGPQADSGAPKSDEAEGEVIDADFEMMDDDKNKKK